MYALFSGQPKLLLMTGYSAIRRALVKGIDKNFPVILTMMGTLLGKRGEMSYLSSPLFVYIHVFGSIGSNITCVYGWTITTHRQSEDSKRNWKRCPFTVGELPVSVF
jgi:hypothetical protein